MKFMFYSDICGRGRWAVARILILIHICQLGSLIFFLMSSWQQSPCLLFDLVLCSFNTHHEVYGFHISFFIAGSHLNNQTQFMHSIVLPCRLITVFWLLCLQVRVASPYSHFDRPLWRPAFRSDFIGIETIDTNWRTRAFFRRFFQCEL